MWFPPKAFPKLNSEELLRATIEDLKVILLNPPTETYVGNMDQTQRGQLINLQEMLHQTIGTTKGTDASILGVPTKAPTAPTTKGAHAPVLGVPSTNTHEASTPRRSNRRTQQPDRYTANGATKSTSFPTRSGCRISTREVDEVHPNDAPPSRREAISIALSPSEFLGMAVNPDTGKLTKYRQLARDHGGT